MALSVPTGDELVAPDEQVATVVSDAMVSPLTKPLYAGRAELDDPYVEDWLEAVMVSGAGDTAKFWGEPDRAWYDVDWAVEAVSEHCPAPTNDTEKPET